MQFHRQSPYIFGMVTLESLDPEQPLKPNSFAGSVTSSLNKWRMPDGGGKRLSIPTSYMGVQ
jgi:hypothetical protein